MREGTAPSQNVLGASAVEAVTFLSFSGEGLAPYAVVLVARLARRWGFDRWRVERMVRKQTGLAYPRREYLKWLRQVSRSAWERPVEQAGPQLAIEQDKMLSDAGQVWIRKRGRISEALRLVEATYASALQLLDAGSAARLLESWNRARNENVVIRLVELAQNHGGWANIDGADLGLLLKRRSWERRSIRLQSVGVSDELRPVLLKVVRIVVPEVKPARFTLLIGPFGAGKTEMAEAWHLTTIRALEESPDAPIPVWIHARELVHASLDRVVAESVGSSQLLHERGSSIVIDGLDEVSGGTAEAIARDARTLVAGSPACSILATSRPNVVMATDLEQAFRHSMKTNCETSWLQSLANATLITNRPAALRESIRRPFFALAAANSVAGGGQLDGSATLIRNLVEKALRRGSSQSITESRELFATLSKLALEKTAGLGAPPPWTFETRQRALATRLVHEDHSSSQLEFSLPIFQQWFAAQAVLERPEAISIVSKGGRPPSFDPACYAQRNTIERGFGRLKQWRGIATRYNKYALTFLGAVLLVATLQYRQ
jgi:transposase